MFQGSFVAIVTPFKDDGSIDMAAFEALIDFHLEEGTDGLVPCGTTGETPTLSKDEKKQLIQKTIEKAKGKLPIIAGTGSYNTKETVEMTKWAADAGADAALVVTPYYNKPTCKGLLSHFEAIAKATDLPIVLYNVPSRTSLNMTPQVVRELAAIPSVKAIKEASGNLSQVMEIAATTDLTILSGDDNLTLPILSVGGKGVISVSANIIPKEMSQLVKYYLEGKTEEARKLALKIFHLCQSLFLETNPIPVKKALELMGKIGPTLRLPLAPMDEGLAEKLKTAMKDFGLLK
ncbi:MAG: 4-hydroxy-tetrahydrodipicolinate synthase [Planctomycetota bacterium]|nr:MAG: 4-hydroxy-tetrahydrodipicolinate synthase [Planctomycetota bacterium]